VPKRGVADAYEPRKMRVERSAVRVCLVDGLCGSEGAKGVVQHRIADEPGDPAKMDFPT